MIGQTDSAGPGCRPNGAAFEQLRAEPKSLFISVVIRPRFIGHKRFPPHWARDTTIHINQLQSDLFLVKCLKL